MSLLARGPKRAWRRLNPASLLHGIRRPRITAARALQLCIVTAITFGLSYVLDSQDTPGETALAVEARRASPRSGEPVAVVRINDAEYDTLFGNRSPMDPAALIRVIQAVASARPRVIGIDVESKDDRYALVPDTLEGVPLVWARASSCIRNGNELPDCPPAERAPERAAGRDEPDSVRAGFVMLPDESNGSTLRYSRMVETRLGTFPSFSTAVLRHAGIRVEPEPADRFRMIRYRPIAGPDSGFTVQSVLQAVENGGFDPDNVLHGKVVLLGGTFAMGRDRNLTPLGEMAGVEVLAQVIRTELEGGGPRPPGKWGFFFVQFFAGIAIVFIFRIPGLGRPLLLAAAFSVAAALVASWMLFGTPALWFSFLPAVGVWVIQELYDHAKNFRDGPGPQRERPGLVPAMAIGPAVAVEEGEPALSGVAPASQALPPVHIFRGDGQSG